MDVRIGGVLIGTLIVISEYLGVLLGIVDQPYLNLLILVLGAFFSASIYREFSIKVFTKLEFIKSIVGGFLMGIGAFLALGDNITGFLMSIVNFSGSAFLFFLGWVLGGFVGIKYQLWELEKYKGLSGLNVRLPKLSFPSAILVLVVLVYLILKEWKWGIWAILGIILQRSKWCMANSFKEPFFYGTTSFNTALVLTIFLGSAGIGILKFYNILDPDIYVLPNFGIFTFFGGFLFGVGMMLVNSCGASLLYKTGEGDLKSLTSLICLLITYSVAKNIIPQHLLHKKEVFLPDYFGYLGSVGMIWGFLIVWFFIILWNSKTKKFLKKHYIF